MRAAAFANSAAEILQIRARPARRVPESIWRKNSPSLNHYCKNRKKFWKIWHPFFGPALLVAQPLCSLASRSRGGVVLALWRIGFVGFDLCRTVAPVCGVRATTRGLRRLKHIIDLMLERGDSFDPDDDSQKRMIQSFQGPQGLESLCLGEGAKAMPNKIRGSPPEEGGGSCRLTGFH